MLQIAQGTKIGIHNNQFGEGVKSVKDALQEGFSIPVFKSVNNPGHTMEVKKLSPATITILRVYRNPDLDGRDLDVYTDIERIADERIKEILNNTSEEERRYVDYFECHNENHPKTIAGWKRLAQLQKLFILLLAEKGYKAAIFGLNCGTPDWNEMEVVFDTGVFQLANQHGAIVTLHEGALPIEGMPEDADAMWGMTNQIPGSPTVIGGGLLTFRYRFWLELAKRRGKGFPPIVLSEFYPVRKKPLHSVEIEKIVNVYKRIDFHMSTDPELVAILPFCIGGPGWEDERHEFAYPKLLEYMAEVKFRKNAVRGENKKMRIKPVARNIRSGPSTNEPILAGVAGGQEVEVIEKNGLWRRVKYEVNGWIHESGLEL